MTFILNCDFTPQVWTCLGWELVTLAIWEPVHLEWEFLALAMWLLLLVWATTYRLEMLLLKLTLEYNSTMVSMMFFAAEWHETGGGGGLGRVCSFDFQFSAFKVE